LAREKTVSSSGFRARMMQIEQGLTVKRTFVELSCDDATMLDRRRRSHSDYEVMYEVNCLEEKSDGAASTADQISEAGEVESTAASSDGDSDVASCIAVQPFVPQNMVCGSYVVVLDEEGFPVMVPQSLPMIAPLMQWGRAVAPAAVAAASSTGFVSSGNKVHSLKRAEVPERTTLIFRNLPNSLSRSSFVQLLNVEGLGADYRFIYLPIDFKRLAGFGYAFVSFASHDAARRALQIFQGFDRWGVPSPKVCNVAWSEDVQGLQAHIDRYRNSPVMHRSVPDDYKPALFNNGVRVSFPAPTRPIKPPRGR